MNVFAIGDLHLSGAVDKPMDIFGPMWEKHAQRIQDAWRALVYQEDIVLLPGDFSWAMHLNDAKADMDYLDALPGKKILVRGNHDYWWSSLAKVQGVLPPSIRVIQNNCVSIGDIHIAGTRGWICPDSAGYLPTDEKIYNREVARLALSLDKMPEGGRRIAMLHYPPFNENRAPSGFTDLLKKHQIQILLYGHLHAKSCKNGFEGIRDGIEFHLVSADHLRFTPKFICSQ